MRLIECPMCESNKCPGGAHYNALMEGRIYTREQWLALGPQGVVIESHNEGMDGL